MGKLKGAIGPLAGAVAGLAGAAALGALISRLRETADVTGKLSTALGINVEALQKLRKGAEFSGLSVSMFDKALKKLGDSQGEFIGGNKIVVDAFTKLGVVMNDAEGDFVSLEELFMRTAQAFKEYPVQVEKAKLANDIFGRSGTELLVMFEQGREGLQGYGRGLEFVGGVMNKKTIRSTEQLNDRINILTSGIDNFFSPALVAANEILGFFTEEIEFTMKPLKEQNKIIQDQINALIKERDTLKEVNNETISWGLSARASAKGISTNKDLLNEQIDALAKARALIRDQIKANDEQAASLRRAAQAQRERVAAMKSEEAAKIAFEEEKLLLMEIEAEYEEKYQTYMEREREKYAELKLMKETAHLEELALMDELEKEYQKKAFDRAVADAKAAKEKIKTEEETVKASLQLIESMAAGVKDSSIEMFRLWQAASIANATISTLSAATRALEYGGPAGPYLAGVIYALGMANVAKIASTQYQGKYLGGDVQMNKSYVVGERGPELFTPGRTGSITPNNKIGGPMTVNVNINAVDAEGIDELLTQRKSLLIGIINQGLNRQGKAAI